MIQKDTNQEEATLRRWWPFPLALVLASIPVLGYLFAYSYQVGYAIAFGIPSDLIRLSNLDVLKVWMPIAGLIVITLGMGPFMLLFLPIKALPRAIKMAPWFVAIGAFTAYLIVVSAGWQAWTTLIILSSIILGLLAFPFKLKRKEREESKSPQPTIMDHLLSIVRAAWIWTPIVVFALWIGVALIGWAFATQRTTFIVLGENGSAPSVVLQIYDDFAITAPLVAGSDGKTHIKQTFTIYRLDALPNQPFRYINVGPLTTAPPK